jgi:hypothetical protein
MIQFSAPLTPAWHDRAGAGAVPGAVVLDDGAALAADGRAGAPGPEHPVASAVASTAGPAAARTLRRRVITG